MHVDRPTLKCHCENEFPALQQGITERIEPGLYVVATPIGCLEDISLRALRILRSCDKILCEDTRRTSILLRHYQVTTPLESYHLYNEYEKIDRVVRTIESGASLALVSDAGMPAINDPGSQLISSAAENGVSVVPIPGPSATLAALVCSGLSTDTFTFCGFAEAKHSSRVKQFKKWMSSSSTLIFFVSPHALLGVLRDACSVFGDDRKCCIARELTKAHEEFWRSSLNEAKDEFEKRGPKGEFTLVIEGCPEKESVVDVSDDDISKGLRQLIHIEGYSPSKAAKEISTALDIPKKRAYALSLLLDEKNNNTK